MAQSIFELTKTSFERLSETEAGSTLMKQFDHIIGFEVAAESQLAEITKRYYFPRYSGKLVTPLERFVVEVSKGKPIFRQEEDVPIPASNWDEFNRYIKLLATRATFEELYQGKLRPVDAIIPAAEQPTRLNILPFLPKWSYASWICRMIKLMAEQNQTHPHRIQRHAPGARGGFLSRPLVDGTLR